MAMRADHFRAEELSLRLLGCPRLESKYGVVRLTEKALCVLAYLVMHRNDGMLRRRQVAFELWPDLSETEACTTMRKALYDIASQVPASEIVTADAAWFRWNSACPIVVDVILFERLSDNPQTVAAALELYRGDLLETLDYDWILTARERLRDQQMINLSRTVEYFRERGDGSSALVFAKRLWALDPWREDVFRDLMVLSYLCGDRAGALRDYALFENRLQRELGVQPMSETSECRAMIARGEVPALAAYSKSFRRDA